MDNHEARARDGAEGLHYLITAYVLAGLGVLGALNVPVFSAANIITGVYGGGVSLFAIAAAVMCGVKRNAELPIEALTHHRWLFVTVLVVMVAQLITFGVYLGSFGLDTGLVAALWGVYRCLKGIYLCAQGEPPYVLPEPAATAASAESGSAS